MAGLYKRSNSPHWQAIWTCPETGSKRRRSTGTSSKREARRIASSWESSPEEANRTTDQPLAALVEVWLKELTDLARTPLHVAQRRRAIRMLGLEATRANTLMGEKSASGDWSDRTVHTYYVSLKQFGRWCVTNGHRDRDPMRGLKKPARRTGRRYIRGVLTRSQASTLCTHQAIPESRRLVYRTALSTGLRIGEIRQLSIDNLKIIKGQTSIHLKPSQVKNRFESVIPISADLAGDLMKGLDMEPFKRGADAIRRDLKLAGLPLKDEDGHIIDFHSLRATYGDLLIRQGVPIPTVARLMRHSDGGALLLKRYAGGGQLGFKDTVLDLTTGDLSNEFSRATNAMH